MKNQQFNLRYLKQWYDGSNIMQFILIKTKCVMLQIYCEENVGPVQRDGVIKLEFVFLGKNGREGLRGYNTFSSGD